MCVCVRQTDRDRQKDRGRQIERETKQKDIQMKRMFNLHTYTYKKAMQRSSTGKINIKSKVISASSQTQSQHTMQYTILTFNKLIQLPNFLGLFLACRRIDPVKVELGCLSVPN